MLHNSPNQFLIGGNESGFEIPFVLTFDPQSRAGEIGGTGIGQFAINDNMLEMNPRAHLPFDSVNQVWIFVKTVTKIRAGFFGVEQPDRHFIITELIQNGEERHHLFSGMNVHVLNISGADPDKGTGFGNALDYLVVKIVVGYKF